MPDREKKKLNIYLDHCSYKRPYDDQTQLRIELEAKAKMYIQNLIEEDRIDLTISYMSELENNDSPIPEHRIPISDFFANAKNIVTETEEIIKEAEKFQKSGLKVHDSIHLSCAIAGGCDCFLSTDDRLLKHADSRIELMNPTDFLKKWEDNDNDE